MYKFLVGIESRKASHMDSEEEEARLKRNGLDESEEQLIKAAAAFGMSLPEYIQFLESRPKGFGTETDKLNPKKRTTRKSPHSGTVFNTSNWDSDWWAGRELGKGKKK